MSNITHVEETCSKGKRDRDPEKVRTLSERKRSTSSRELVDKNAQLRNDYLKLTRTWKQESGKREVLIWLFVKPIENLSLKDWRCIKLINGLIRLREKASVFVENWQ